MKPITYKAIILAAIGGFIVSSIWYILFGNVWMEARGAGTVAGEPSPIETALVELTRNLLLSGVLAYLIVRLKITTGPQALRLSLLLWLGFPLILLSGSVFHEGVPWVVAAIHGGDWLIKITLIALILTKYRVGLSTNQSTS